jgi:alpha,alpha-trehalase
MHTTLYGTERTATPGEGDTFSMPDFKPVEWIDGYLPIEDHALIGDCTGSALVARDGSIPWMCVPRFDSPPIFSQILDNVRGGAFEISLDGMTESRQYYIEDTGVLVTELKSTDGLIRITDAMTLRHGIDLNEDAPPGRRELLRHVEVLQGPVDLRIDFSPRGGADIERSSGGYLVTMSDQPDCPLTLDSSIDLDGLHTEVTVQQDDDFYLTVQWKRVPHRFAPSTHRDRLDATIEAWRNWVGCFHYEGPQHDRVRRSAIALKMMDYLPTGAIVAAPTSSLPEAIGGPRNWDYRYAWVRDCAFSVFALRRIGLENEAWAFLGWVLDAVERDGHPHVLYTLEGDQPAPEWKDPDLEGYRQSPPVRWGNGAADQRQHDVYGEILDVAYQWGMPGGSIDDHLWERLSPLVDAAAEEWRTPDHGIWEIRSDGRLFTYSSAMCLVALERGARLSETFGLPGDASRWRAEAETIRNAILEEAWDPELNSLTEHIGDGGGLDASLLTLPLRGVIPADHPKMVATTQAVMDRLGAGDGLIYRYLPDESPDGLPGHEGAFLLCSFWYVDNLAKQGRLDEAMDLYNSLCDRANSAGLLPEQIDPPSGRFLGNFPQAFSHVGVVSSGVNIQLELERQKSGGS